MEFTRKRLIKKLLAPKGANLVDLSIYFKTNPNIIIDELKKMAKEGYQVRTNDIGIVKLSNIVAPAQSSGLPELNLSALSTNKLIFGVTGDNHLASRFSRLDVLNSLYQEFKKAGVKVVYNTGNMIDGYIKRINGNDVIESTLDGQVNYFLSNYPKIPGIVTKFVTGDDHEGWFQKDLGVEVGKYIEYKAKEAGRKDLHYLGFVERDIKYKTRKGDFTLKVMHPGGGSAYALSYAPQKLVESFEVDEKPSMLLIGHYHKAEYLPDYNGIHVIQSGSTIDQTPFLRKKKIKSMLGGWIIKVDLLKEGVPFRIEATYLSYRSMGFYKENDYYKINKKEVRK